MNPKNIGHTKNWRSLEIFAINFAKTQRPAWTQENTISLKNAVDDLCHMIIQKTAGQKAASGEKRRKTDIDIAANIDRVEYQIIAMTAQLIYSGRLEGLHGSKTMRKDKWPWIYEMIYGVNLFYLGADRPPSWDEKSSAALKEAVERLASDYTQTNESLAILHACFLVFSGVLDIPEQETPHELQRLP